MLQSAAIVQVCHETEGRAYSRLEAKAGCIAAGTGDAPS